MANRNALDDESILQSALIGLQYQHNQIESKISEIRWSLGIRAPRTTPTMTYAAAAPARRTMSAAARRKIAAAQKKRWALARKAEDAPSAPKKRKISAAGMKRIIAATKKRWAAVRAQKAAVVKEGAKPKTKKATAAKKTLAVATAAD